VTVAVYEPHTGGVSTSILVPSLITPLVPLVSVPLIETVGFPSQERVKGISSLKLNSGNIVTRSKYADLTFV